MNQTGHRPRGIAMAGGVLLMLAAAPAARAQYALEPAFPSVGAFVGTTDIQRANDGTYRMFVVEKRGLIWVFESEYTATTRSVFLDIQDRVRATGEAGLLGLAFHPDYRYNGQFFVFYVTKYPSRSIVARYTVSADPGVANRDSETILIDSPQPSVYHNGGQLVFGRDRMLYIGMGDNLLTDTAQNLTDLPGSILRIDVDVIPPPDGSAAPKYEIPADNPFAGNASGWREEIFAYGFRNPWRFSIDPMTGEMWVADVGQDTWEEINLVEKGRNYGWPFMEGPACFDPVECDTAGRALEPPLYTYSHEEGVAVIGGYRYWGRRLPELAGLYLFADYAGGKVWALRFDGAGTPERFDLVTGAPFLTTFGMGFQNEILMASSDGGIFRLSRVATAVTPAPVPAPGARLLGNFPNPFNPSTTIRFQLDRAADASVEIVAVDGRIVRHLGAAPRAAGEHRVSWDGRNAAGARVASGVYFARLIVGGAAADAARMVLVQ
jgi:glucose/arabinose dehydrogenase